MYFSFFVKFLQLAMQFAVQLLLVQLLSKSAYGSYSYIVAVLGIVAVIIQQGLPELTMREVARAIAQGASSGAHRILLLSCGMFALNISVFFVVATVFQNVFAASVGMLLPIWPQMILILLAGGVLRIIAGYYRGLGSYVIGLSVESLMFPALFLLGTMLVALLKPNLSWEDISAPINIHTVAIFGLGNWDVRSCFVFATSSTSGHRLPQTTGHKVAVFRSVRHWGTDRYTYFVYLRRHHHADHVGKSD